MRYIHIPTPAKSPILLCTLPLELEEASELAVSFLDTIKTSVTAFIAPWNHHPVSCATSFTHREKLSARYAILQHLSLQHKYQCAQFYTDASKTANYVSCAAHGPSFTISKTMNCNTSTFTAEACGILVEFDFEGYI